MLKMQKGVTLIELMIVVIIISVLSTVAIPSYRGYMVKAHRVDAQSSLLKMAVAGAALQLTPSVSLVSRCAARPFAPRAGDNWDPSP